MTPTPADHTRQALLDAARKRIDDALAAWLSDDFDGAASTAPAACELLGKAALWTVQPTLLVPLDANAEPTLVELATSPSLASPTLRTIGLKAVFTRLERVYGELPVSRAHRTRLTDCRNGHLHVGTLPTAPGLESAETIARHVVSDCLLMCRFLLDELHIAAADFFGDRLMTVNSLLTEQRSEVEHRVARLLEQATDSVAKMRAHVDNDDMWKAFAGELSAADSAGHDDDTKAIPHTCPSCGYKGRLVGRVEVRDEMQTRYENGTPTEAIVFRFVVHPRTFGCRVCRLSLRDRAELEAAGLTSVPTEVEFRQLGVDLATALSRVRALDMLEGE